MARSTVLPGNADGAASEDDRNGADRALAEQLAALPDLPLDELKRRWRNFYGVPPPSRLGRALMVRAIAYRIQE